MLPNTLNTNEVKDSAGAELEYSRLSQSDRSTVFARISENPSNPDRIRIDHAESGSGLNRLRRSRIRVDLTQAGQVDATKLVTSSVNITLVAPVGQLSTTGPLEQVLARLQSFLSTTGAGTTVLFDGSGNGASALIEGSL